MQLIDIGANIGHESFADDFDDMLARAAQAGVTRMVVTGSDAQSNADAIALAQTYPDQLFATAGLHPHHASDWNDDLAAAIGQASRDQQIVAIGETGLDYFRDISPRGVQQQAFAAQLAVAAEYGLPVFLHQRDAHADFLAILREHLPDIPAAVVHCFTDTSAALDDYLTLGCHIGITGWICDERRGEDLYQAVPEIPDNRLMIETDSPYLMPRTIRPKPKTRRNEPCNLPYILASVAAARSQSPAAVAQYTTRNAEHFFNLPAGC